MNTIVNGFCIKHGKHWQVCNECMDRQREIDQVNYQRKEIELHKAGEYLRRINTEQPTVNNFDMLTERARI